MSAPPTHWRSGPGLPQAGSAHDECRSTPAWRAVLGVLTLALLVCAGSPVGAEEPTREQMQGLDEQVQEIKSDVLRIASELSLLEERLLFPSNTQVSVFVSLAEGESLQLDSLRIEIDGELVAHHIYAFNELQALEKGGVQRIYTGNVPTGEHQLQVFVDGKLPSGADVSRTEGFEFRKDAEPKLVEITLAGDAGIRLEEQ